ncbi:carboxylate-amine ligase [Actinoplanes sp. CA-252034]|uniref:carboxylate-amine ligase n=1 Tax=Actinoplanes sp. CA-252034 TaxID=3239906 RepID=UPI003D964FAC
MNTITVPAPLPSSARLTEPPVVVEEELLLIDEHGNGAVSATWPPPSGPGPGPRLMTLVSSPATDLTALREELLGRRRVAASVAARGGARLLAVGASPAHGPVGGGLVIRVQVPDGRIAVRVCRALQAWLPVAGALTSNSPFESGTDTGHASWRFVRVHQRALGAYVATPRSLPAATDVSAMCEAAEARLPESLRYPHARPGAGAVVQIRAGDVGLSVDDTIVATGLLRAAVALAVHDARTGKPETPVDPETVRRAQWQAARQGLTGWLTDPRTGRATPGWQMLDRFAETVTPVDTAHLAVQNGLARLRAEGTGAERQRRIAQRTTGARTLLTVLAQLTVQG